MQWIAADNVSDRGNGRLVVSYDSSLTTIVWDVVTGDEIARFASYEDIRTAAWMKNSSIAFGMTFPLFTTIHMLSLSRKFPGQRHSV